MIWYLSAFNGLAFTDTAVLDEDSRWIRKRIKKKE
jgi:hypothetical protein